MNTIQKHSLFQSVLISVVYSFTTLQTVPFTGMDFLYVFKLGPGSPGNCVIFSKRWSNELPFTHIFISTMSVPFYFIFTSLSSQNTTIFYCNHCKNLFSYSCYVWRYWQNHQRRRRAQYIMGASLLCSCSILKSWQYVCISYKKANLTISSLFR